MKAARTRRAPRAQETRTVPLALELLASFTGLAAFSDIHLAQAHAAAVDLARSRPNGPTDCDTTYKAITRLIAAMGIDEDRHSRCLRVTLSAEQQDEHLATIIAARTDASFLLGFTYAYALMAVLGGKEAR